MNDNHELFATKFEYFKCHENEEAIKSFWNELERRMIEKAEDSSLIEYNIKREFVSATIGELAGILVTIVTKFPEYADSTKWIYQAIQNHLLPLLAQKKEVRVHDQNFLRNYCKLHLAENGVSNPRLVESKKLFSDNEELQKQNAYYFKFEDSEKVYHFTIANNAEITEFNTEDSHAI